MTVLAVLTVWRFWRAPSPSLCLSLQNRVPRGNHDGFDSFDGFGGSGRDGYPPINSTPLFRDPEFCVILWGWLIWGLGALQGVGAIAMLDDAAACHSLLCDASD